MYFKDYSLHKINVLNYFIYPRTETIFSIVFVVAEKEVMINTLRGDLYFYNCLLGHNFYEHLIFVCLQLIKYLIQLLETTAN